MRTIVAGSRAITDAAIVEKAILESGIEVTELVSGGAAGVDQLAEAWARQRSIPVTQFLPNWKRCGRRAALMRNVDMAKYAEACIAVWDGQSRGTYHMIRTAKSCGLRLQVCDYSRPVSVNAAQKNG